MTARRAHYLDDPPSPAEISRVLALLGTDAPRALMRTGEPATPNCGWRTRRRRT